MVPRVSAIMGVDCISRNVLISDFEIRVGFPNRWVNSVIALSFIVPSKNIPAIAFSAVPLTDALR